MILNSPVRGYRLFVEFVAVLILLLLISTSGFAQSASNPRWDAFIGYQYQQADGDDVPAAGSNPNAPIAFRFPDMDKGGGVALTYNFDPYWGWETDFGYSRNTDQAASDLTLSTGPRFTWRTETAAFFLHALPGLNRVSYESGGVTHNGIGAVLGGGMDLPFSKRFSWRLFQVDYVWGRHNFANLAGPEFPKLRRPTFEGARLRTGIVLNFGGAEAVPPAAACSVQPTEVLVGEPITATVTPSNFNPKHTVTYSWKNGGQATGTASTATIDTTNVAPGSYTVTAHVTDPRVKSNNVASCSANYTVKPLPPKNPPTMSLTANPTSVPSGGSVTVTASCTSPDGVPTSVAKWAATAGTVSGSGNTATLGTTGAAPGTIMVTAACSDTRGLESQAQTQVTVENPPRSPAIEILEARLALHSIYYPTAQPATDRPGAGLVPSQQRTLQALATDFKTYLQSKPDAHLVLEGHADIRGTDEYNQRLTERRVGSVKAYLVGQGIPESNIETVAYGKQRNLTTDEVKASIEGDTDLTTEERRRALARITVIKLASNRRVDVTLKSAGQATETSVRKFPFNAADALSLIGGRESERKKTIKPVPRKKPVRKPAPKP
jgi:hypothetical protein